MITLISRDKIGRAPLDSRLSNTSPKVLLLVNLLAYKCRHLGFSTPDTFTVPLFNPVINVSAVRFFFGPEFATNADGEQSRFSIAYAHERETQKTESSACCLFDTME